jgi:VWFA-related protein
MYPPARFSRRELLRLCAMAVPVSRAFAWQQDPKFSTTVSVVNVFATVHDKNGKIVHDLTQDDFAIEEDERPQRIAYFSQQSDLPLTLGLLVDTSVSQYAVLDEERAASFEFFQHVLREDKDKAFVIHFDREVELLQDVTSSRNELEAAIHEIEGARPELNRRGSGSPQPGGGGPQGGGGRQGGGGFAALGTTLYDAVLLASDELMQKQQGRKAEILLSDGVDLHSKVSLTSAIESAQRADTMIYAIRFAAPEQRQGFGGAGPVVFGGPGIGIGGRRRGGGGRGGGGAGAPQQQGRRGGDGKKVLQQMAEETGGSYFEVSKKTPLDRIYDLVEEELRNQYSLGYTSDQHTGLGYRKIRVTVKRKGLTVQAREGYYPGS